MLPPPELANELVVLKPTLLFPDPPWIELVATMAPDVEKAAPTLMA
jgi:hypothetical protein